MPTAIDRGQKVTLHQVPSKRGFKKHIMWFLIEIRCILYSMLYRYHQQYDHFHRPITEITTMDHEMSYCSHHHHHHHKIQ